MQFKTRDLKLICTNQGRVYHGRTQARGERRAGTEHGNLAERIRLLCCRTPGDVT